MRTPSGVKPSDMKSFWGWTQLLRGCQYTSKCESDGGNRSWRNIAVTLTDPGPILKTCNRLTTTVVVLSLPRDAKEKPPRHWAAAFFNFGQLKVSLRYPEHHVAFERVLG